MDHLTQFQKGRSVGVPIMGIETPDQEATIRVLAATGKNGKAAMIGWDIVRGFTAMNEAGAAVLAKIASDPTELKGRTVNVVEALDLAVGFPDDAIVFARNIHRVIDEAGVSQAIANLRDGNKAKGRTLVLLAPFLRLPVELERDVIVLEEPLPSDQELGAIVKGVYEDAGMSAPTEGHLDHLISASRGLAAFQSEQAAAMALTKAGVDRVELWERKRKMIELTPGLSVVRGSATFAEIGGIENVKAFGASIFKGQARPSCVVFLDEIEKALGGATGEVGDSSGVAQDALGVLLKAMEDNAWTGQIAVGPPGCAKSMFAQALGATHDVPTIALDLGAAKGSLVGQSEARVRGIVRVLKAVAGSGAYWVATCNRLETLPPELRRRFRFGLWYFDLPDAVERAAIWTLQMKRYQVRADQAREMPDDAEWTGADIRNCCEIAWRLNASLVAAAQFITPVAKSNPEAIKKLRDTAHARFLSASYAGTFDRERKVETKGRKISI
jgi:hypothetical protein